MKKCILFFILFLGSAAVFAQENTIRGKIVDETTNAPIPGAEVSIKGNRNSTVVTNVAGEFTLKAPSSSSVHIHSLGYNDTTIIAGKDFMAISLTPVASNLNQVVVIGYGTQKRKDVTSAISSLSGEQLHELPVSNVNMAIQGRIPGLQVTSAGNQPGAGTLARIRGINSINVTNGPLYVVDGVITTGDLREINPSDIESIDVLKDASAAAIYGARAAEGVIIITTKKARQGVTTINYDGYYGVQKIITPYQFVNGRQYEQIRRQAYFDDNPDPNFLNDTTTDKHFDKQMFNNLELQSIAQGKTYDWASKITQVAPIQSHTISVSGGGDKSSIYVSGNYFSQDGIIKNSNLTRYSLNVNGNVEVNRNLKLILNSNISHLDNKILDQQVYYNALTMSPLMPFTDTAGNSTIFMDPTKGSLFLINNPVLLTQHPVYQQDDRLLGSLALEYKILEGLKFRTAFNTDIYGDKKYTYYPSTININNSYTQKGYGAIENFGYRDYTSENVLSYDKAFGENHSISAMAGLTYERRRQEYNYMTGTGFPSDETGYKDMSLAQNKTIGSSFFNWALLSEMGRVIYKFKDRYILNASIRRDGSSYFGENNRYGTFPSVSAAWRLIDEPFMDQVKSKSVLSDAKIRASYGEIGNYNRNYAAIYPAMSSAGYPFDNSTVTTGFQVGTSYLANPNLQWERQMQSNVGFDLGLLNNRITLTTDLYNKNIRNLLLDVLLPPSSMYYRQTINVAQMNTKGIDIKLHWDVIKSGDFQWQAEINWSTYKSKITKLLPGVDSLRPDLKVGEAPNSLIIDYVYDGMYQAGDSVMLRNLGAKPGSVKVKDLNNDGLINANDMTIVGRTTPKGWGGIWNYWSYKGVSLIVFANYMYGHSIYNKAYQDYLYPDGHRVNLKETMNYWTPGNTNTDVPRPNAFGSSVKTLPGGTSSFAVQKGNFLKIRNITVGYNFQKKILDKFKLHTLSAYLQVTNPFIFTHYKGVDPEISQLNTGTWSGQGYELYPSYRTYLLGIKIGL